jgi:organic hydroperoxide reductase OsmC/OhrA
MPRRHSYETQSIWTGDRGQGTSDYRAYARTYDTTTAGRPAIPGSSDPAFRGDADRWNPELLLVAALSQCHMLSYLHRCAVSGVVVTAYEDAAEGVMVETDDGGGHFQDVVLRPLVTVSEPGMVERAQALHEDAAALCFIAASVNFPVRHEPRAIVRGEG